MNINIAPGVNPQVLRHYLDARKVIAKRTDRICDITHILSLLQHCADSTIPVDPQVLASFADRINSDTCAIIETLDQFIYILDAEKQLNGET